MPALSLSLGRSAFSISFPTAVEIWPISVPLPAEDTDEDAANRARAAVTTEPQPPADEREGGRTRGEDESTRHLRAMLDGVTLPRVRARDRDARSRGQFWK
jgi:hypothetical protein